MTMLLIILQALYLFTPAYAANMAPPVAAKARLPGGTPISARLFGTHKTWRGVYSAYCAALLTLILQRFLEAQGLLDGLRILSYHNLSLPLLAVAFGIGAIAGDAVKSFVKRRLGHPPGRPWPPFDQIDFVLGALILLVPFVAIPLPHLLVILILTPLLSVITNIVSFWFGFKNVWW